MGFVEENQPTEQNSLIKKPELSESLDPMTGTKDDTRWSTGLCDCCAQPGGGALGCVSLFMPFVQYGVLAEQLPKGSTFLAGNFCSAASLFLCLDVAASMMHMNLWPGVNLLPISALLHMEMRKHLRSKYGIKGSFWSDLCTTWWCGPCALAQETREVVIRAQKQQELSGEATETAQKSIHMIGNVVLTAPTLIAPGSNAGGVILAEPVPATGVPVGYPAVPPTHVATVTLAGKDTAAPALAN